MCVCPESVLVVIPGATEVGASQRWLRMVQSPDKVFFIISWSTRLQTLSYFHGDYMAHLTTSTRGAVFAITVSPLSIV